LIAAGLLPAWAAAQTQQLPPIHCESTGSLRHGLEARYNESAHMYLVANEGRQLYTVYWDKADGSWTIISTLNRSTSCIVASGQGAVMAEQLEGDPS